MRNPLLVGAFATLALAYSSADAFAQPGYAMPSEYPGFGVYAPGTSRALSYGVTPTSIPGWYGPYRAGPATPSGYRTVDAYRGTGSGTAVYGWRTYGGRGWRR